MSADRKDVRTSVSLATVVWAIAEERMAAKGFNGNFSAYLADLIRRDQERTSYAATPMNDSPSSAGSAAAGKIVGAAVDGLTGAATRKPSPVPPVKYKVPRRSKP